MTIQDAVTLKGSDVKVGDEVPAWELAVTSTVIVAGAIASRDFMPAHHDKDYATGQGAPDIFMNILSTNAYVSRYVTDWAGSDAMVRSIKIRLGAPSVPGNPMRFSGAVTKTTADGEDVLIELAVRAETALGDHATGTVEVSVPST